MVVNSTTLLNEEALSLRERSPSEVIRGTVNVIGLNFRDVRLPRAARVQRSFLYLAGTSGGAELVGTTDHVATRISAVANCAEEAR